MVDKLLGLGKLIGLALVISTVIVVKMGQEGDKQRALTEKRDATRDSLYYVKHKIQQTRDSLYMIDLVNSIAIQNGALVDYSLIDKNIKSAVKKGTRNVIAHNKMMMQAEHDKFEIFEVDWLGHGSTFMKATLRKDSIPLLEEIKISN